MTADEAANDLARETASAFLALLPKYDVSFCLEHNDHKVNYQTVADAVKDWERRDDGYSHGPTWVSTEERQKAIDTDELWECQWYPRTAVSFHHFGASSLEALLAYIVWHDIEES